MSRRYRWFVAVGILGLATPAVAAEENDAPPSRASSSAIDEARRHEREARAAAERGEYARAARGFARAHAAAPNGVVKYNEAYSWEQAGRMAPAADAYVVAIASGDLTAEGASDARERLQELRSQLARVRVEGPSGTKISLGHRRHAALPLEVHLDPGHVTATLHEQGSSVPRRLEVEAVAGERVVLQVALPTPKPSPPPSIASTAGPPREPSEWPSTLAYVGWGLTGAGAVSLAVVGSLALVRRQEYRDTGFTSDDLRVETKTLRDAANVLVGVTAGLAAASLTLTLVEAFGASEDTLVGVRLGANGAEVTVHW